MEREISVLRQLEEMFTAQQLLMFLLRAKIFLSVCHVCNFCVCGVYFLENKFLRRYSWMITQPKIALPLKLSIHCYCWADVDIMFSIQNYVLE